MAWNYPLTFDSKEPFCTYVVSTLSDRVFSFLCPCHDYSLEVRDRTRYLPCFCWLQLPELEPTYLISRNASRRVTDFKFPTWSPPISYLILTKTQEARLSNLSPQPRVWEEIQGVRRRKWQPTPVFLPGESRGQTSLVGCCPRGCTESDTTEVT